MNDQRLSAVLQGDMLDNSHMLSMQELCGLCSVDERRIVRLVDEGVVDPIGNEPSQWQFTAVTVTRVRFVERLARDLDVNTPGAALALELVDELEQLRARLQRLESLT